MKPTLETMSDMELVIAWIYHIQNPCTVEVNGETKNIREFYIRESRENVLPILTNPYAIELLQGVIDQYS